MTGLSSRRTQRSPNDVYRELSALALQKERLLCEANAFRGRINEIENRVRELDDKAATISKLLESAPENPLPEKLAHPPQPERTSAPHEGVGVKAIQY
ncbi:MAG: hypothetical protein H8E20_12865 [Verrucomicrobia bacterium]|nr:hypothetical protein [Verrucomicrobiota bacterium]